MARDENFDFLIRLDSVDVCISRVLNISSGFLSKKQNFHPMAPKNMKISVGCMKFQGASIGKVPGGPK